MREILDRMVAPGKGQLLKVGRVYRNLSGRLIWLEISGHRSFIFVEDLLALIRGSRRYTPIMEFEKVEVVPRA